MIFRSPYREVASPEVSLVEYVLHRAAELADKPALINGLTHSVMTYGELARMVERAAAGLAEKGLKKGDVLAIFSPNLPEYAVAFYAAIRLGGIVTTINPICTTAEVAKQLKDAHAKYLVTVPQLMEKATAAILEAEVREVFVFGEADEATSFASLLQS